MESTFQPRGDFWTKLAPKALVRAPSLEIARSFEAAGYAPGPCRAALERIIAERGLPPSWFRPEEIEHGGRFATDDLLFPADQSDSWRWAGHCPSMDSPFSVTLPPEEVGGVAAVIRALGAGTAPEQFRADWSDVLDDDLLVQLARCLTVEVPFGRWPVPRTPGVYRREHASIAIASRTTTVLVDLQGLSGNWTTLDRYPAESGPYDVDLVALTHAHEDHWDLSSILRYSSADTPALVPRVPRLNFLTQEAPESSLTLAGQHVLAPEWFSTVRVGDIEIDVLPFYGEQPTQQAPGAPDGVRNWGNVYRFNTPDFSALVLADSGVDPLGSVVDVARRSFKARGAVDLVLSNVRAFPEGAFGLSDYLLTLSFDRLREIGRRFTLTSRCIITSGVHGLAQVCEAARASVLLPYAHGFQGLGRDPVAPGDGLTEGELTRAARAAVSAHGTKTEVVTWMPGDAFCRSELGGAFARLPCR